VFLGKVGNFVGQYKSKFGFIVQVREQAGSDKNIALVGANGIHQIRLQGKKVELCSDIRLLREQPIGYFLDILGNGIAVENLATFENFIDYKGCGKCKFFLFRNLFSIFRLLIDCLDILHRFGRARLEKSRRNGTLAAERSEGQILCIHCTDQQQERPTKSSLQFQHASKVIQATQKTKQFGSISFEVMMLFNINTGLGGGLLR